MSDCDLQLHKLLHETFQIGILEMWLLAPKLDYYINFFEAMVVYQVKEHMI
jgi:hypothetical protein